MVSMRLENEIRGKKERKKERKKTVWTWKKAKERKQRWNIIKQKKLKIPYRPANNERK